MSRLTDPDGICIARKLPCKGQQQIQHSKSIVTGNIELSNFKFDQEKSRRALENMIIKHNYPFYMCEHEFFEKLCNKKMKLYEFLDALDCRITLTTDIWASKHANIAYTCLTAHYFNDNWI
ncbi:hypothetical protein M9H77_09604 [Catharanthus roseus]|uniref:Uncharacterized protein n=1 Tax=Catharanthus roseus TaxID=4058 RepID=A0ACC0C1A3_CATRO|nr:hypothetical protein M9H77_09604 [Catharanthus roseus]